MVALTVVGLNLRKLLTSCLIDIRQSAAYAARVLFVVNPIFDYRWITGK